MLTVPAEKVRGNATPHFRRLFAVARGVKTFPGTCRNIAGLDFPSLLETF
jgi:hypothetical protein